MTAAPGAERLSPRRSHDGKGGDIKDTTAILLAAIAVLVSGAGSAHAISFDPYTSYPTGGLPDSVAIGDVTSDGRNDVLMTTDQYDDPENDLKLFVFAQGSDGSLSRQQTLDAPAWNGRYEIVVGDLVGDGGVDAAVGGKDGVALYKQSGGALTAPALIAGSPATVGDLALADVNGDGADDLVVSSAGGVSVLLQRTAVSGFESKPVSALVTGPIAVGDVNGDDRPDVVAVSTGDQPYALRLYLQQANGSFVEDSIALSFLHDGDPNAIAIADVSGDGRDDIVVTRGGNDPSSELAVYVQSPDGQITTPPDVYWSYDIPDAVRVLDMDGDGLQDVVIGHAGWRRVGVYLQGQDGFLEDEQLLGAEYGTYGNSRLALSDVNSDAMPDIAVADHAGRLGVIRQRTPLELAHVGVDGGRLTASWNLPASLNSDFIEVGIDPEIYEYWWLDPYSYGLFLEENTVLFDVLADDQTSYVSPDPLPPGTYYVHVGGYQTPLCRFPPPDAFCTDEISPVEEIVVPADSPAAPQSKPPAASVAADRTAALRSVRAASRQSLRRLRVKASMGEDGTITAQGTVAVPGASAVFKLRPVSGRAKAGATVTLKLKLSRKARKAVVAAIRRHRRVRAKLVITARDRAGNTAVEKRTVALKR